MTAVLLFLRAGGWRYVIGAIVLAGLAIAVHRFSESRFQAGQADRNAYWQAEMDKEHAVAALALQAANQKAIEAERLGQSRVVEVSNQFDKEISNANLERDQALAAIRNGQRLRVDLATPARCGGGGVSEATAAAGSGDGPGTGELSEGSSQRLVEFAARADRIAAKLRACQQVIRADQEEINGTSPSP